MTAQSRQMEHQHIERRYGFALPQDYCAMQERGLFSFDPDKDGNVAFDPTGCQWMED